MEFSYITLIFTLHKPGILRNTIGETMVYTFTLDQ